MTTRSSTSKSEIAYVHIREQIVNGTWGADYKINFAEIAKSLQMSTVPVREAVRKLESEGFIVFVQNFGARVVG